MSGALYAAKMARDARSERERKRKPKCPKCGSLSHTLGMTTRTCMGISTWTDESGNIQSNDPNITTSQRTCRKCSHTFIVEFQYGEIVV